MRRCYLLLAALIVGASMLVSPHAEAQTAQRCFTETGKCISGAIRQYWEQNGGLPVFGFPISDVTNQDNGEGFNGPTQLFERDRLEDQGTKGVLAGRLGAQKLAAEGRPWQGLPKVSSAPAGCLFFKETGHSLCPPFRAYWERNGGVTRFGFPISEPNRETNADGFTGTFQWFERRRAELHPENKAPFDILLGLLGKELSGNAPVGGAACEGIPAPFNVTRDPISGCIRVGQTLNVVAFDFTPNQTITYQLTNEAGGSVSAAQTATSNAAGEIRVAIDTNSFAGSKLAPGDYVFRAEAPNRGFRAGLAPFRVVP